MTEVPTRPLQRPDGTWPEPKQLAAVETEPQGLLAIEKFLENFVEGTITRGATQIWSAACLTFLLLSKRRQ